MDYRCCEDHRRAALASHPGLNGIDFLTVRHDPGVLGPAGWWRLIEVHFAKVSGLAVLTAANFRIECGPDAPAVQMRGLDRNETCITLRVSPAGDFSPYTLRLVAGDGSDAPPHGFDPPLSRVEFFFRAACETDLDCRQETVCQPETVPAPDIDYLAKDYGAFRRLMLDRISSLVPDWERRSPADLGVTLVELLAYAADHISYAQDAVAAEAYLATARRRVSVKRHARLVDYRMHEGCASRAFVHLRLSAEAPAGGLDLPRLDPSGRPVCYLTRVPGEARLDPETAEALIREHAPTVFEALADARLYPAHNAMPLHAFGGLDCCLARGATSAALAGHYPGLQAGDWLLFEEVKGPESGAAQDADPTHRHIVRLTAVTPDQDRLGGHFLGGPGNAAQPITHIAWHADDALPFPLCLSRRRADGSVVRAISLARGNLILMDQGLTLDAEDLDSVPAPRLTLHPAAAHCRDIPPRPVPARFTPELAQGPLAWTNPPPGPLDSARAALATDPHSAAPALALEDDLGHTWPAANDLLGCTAADRRCVAEVDDDGRTRLRFGDDRYGMRPDTGTGFSAVYRVGNGPAGNVGAGAIRHVACTETAIEAVTNPLPATGGTAPEAVEAVRVAAPVAFRRQERAVTVEDYAEVSQRFPTVQRARAEFRFTGSWRTAFVTADRQDNAAADAAFRAGLAGHLERYRMAGQDVAVARPRFVALEVRLRVCVAPCHFRGHVEQALREVLTSGRLADGGLGLFHPDRFSFGEPVWLSPIVAAAMAVTGVESVKALIFRRLGGGQTWPNPVQTGVIRLGPSEIARLDNDPSHPERGVLELTLEGGK